MEPSISPSRRRANGWSAVTSPSWPHSAARYTLSSSSGDGAIGAKRRIAAVAGQPFVHTFRVRYHECDAQGIVFNANWFTYFDVALTEWFRVLFGSYGSLAERGSDVVLAETSARFRGSGRFDDEISVAVGVESLGRTSMVVAYTA